LAAEERFRAAPLRVNDKTRIAREVRTRLNVEELIVQLNASDVAGASGRERDFARPAARSEGRDEGRLASDRALERAHQPALHLRLKLDVRGHRDHRARL